MNSGVAAAKGGEGSDSGKKLVKFGGGEHKMEAARLLSQGRE